MSKKLAATIVGGAKTESAQEPVRCDCLARRRWTTLNSQYLESLSSPNPKASTTLVVGAVEIHIPLAGMVDESAERERLTRELAEVESHIARLEKLLSSDFANKAPAPWSQRSARSLLLSRRPPRS